MRRKRGARLAALSYGVFSNLLLVAFFSTSFGTGCAHPSLNSEVDAQSFWTAPSACDEQDEVYRKQLANILDSKEAAINAYWDPKAKPVFKRYPLGSFSLLERISPRKPNVKDHWTKDSWKMLADRAHALESTSINSAWWYLDEDVRSLLFDDSGRRYFPNSMIFTMRVKDFIDQAYRESVRCTSDKNCTTPKFEANALAFMKTRNEFAPYLTGRENLEKLKTNLLKDYQSNYGFWSNPTIKRVSAHELVIPMDPGPLACCTGFLATAMEEAWSTPDLKVRIEWGSSNYFHSLFQIEIDPHLSAREHVSYHSRTMTLHSGEQIKVLAHEFGHVLGFPDHYYTEFNEKTCRYTIYDDSGDLMSNGEKPTEEKLRILNLAYPWKAK